MERAFPAQQTFSVRGFIDLHDRSKLPESGNAALLSVDGLPFPFGESKDIYFHTFFPLPNLKYFQFDNVLPGRYALRMVVPDGDWYTNRVELASARVLNS